MPGARDKIHCDKFHREKRTYCAFCTIHVAYVLVESQTTTPVGTAREVRQRWAIESLELVVWRACSHVGCVKHAGLTTFSKFFEN